ncbi:MAG TPA: peptide-methionine (S)-S-oxide reductase MsrA [Gemmatimonadaceae bacterium]|nr:peptide-methionine (S)-S-oxide reductase MsrA [Gemmatimonadaceae bacterium]
MKRSNRLSGFPRSAATLALALLGGALYPARTSLAESAAPAPKNEQTVVFAGGCFWGIQAVFQHTKGVIRATSGYSGGRVDKPDYEEVSSGRTGHAESVRVVFDPSQISYDQLLRIFFTVAHDPTELNHQGPDVGTQYRSAIFYMNPEQKRAAEQFIDQLNKEHVYPRPIVTQVTAFTAFWPAEAYHQDYAEIHPDEPYILVNDAPKVANLRKEFPQWYTDKLAAHE